MARSILTLAAVSGVALFAAACQPVADEPAETTTVVETREVPVVVERPAPVVVEVPSTPPVVIEDRRDNDSTTVRAGRDGIEVETTNR